MPLTGPDGKPIMGKDGKPATVTMSVEPDPAAAVPPERVVIEVGGEKITAGELDRAHQCASRANAQRQARGQGRREFAEELVRLKLLAQEARRQKLDQSPDFQAQAAFQTENLLAAKIFQELAKSVTSMKRPRGPSTKSTRTNTSACKCASYPHPHGRVSASGQTGAEGHSSEEEALAKARRSARRSRTAPISPRWPKPNPTIPARDANGGDLGFFRARPDGALFRAGRVRHEGRRISASPCAASSATTSSRWKNKKAKSFEEARPEIEQKLRPEMAPKTLEEMRKTAAVTFDPVYLRRGKAVSAAPPTAPAEKPAREERPAAPSPPSRNKGAGRGRPATPS